MGKPYPRRWFRRFLPGFAKGIFESHKANFLLDNSGYGFFDGLGGGPGGLRESGLVGGGASLGVAPRGLIGLFGCSGFSGDMDNGFLRGTAESPLFLSAIG